MRNVILFTLLILISGCSGYAQIKEVPEPTIIKEYTYIENTTRYDELIDRFNKLIIKHNSLIINYNKLIGERDFWKSENYRLGSQIELCKDKQTNVPIKTLYKITICPRCYYHLICENANSMLPFFDCNDTLTGYTNIEKSEIGVCDIIGFKNPEYPELDFVIHQVINVNESGYTTKGVANTNQDNYTVQFDDIKFKFIGVEYK